MTHEQRDAPADESNMSRSANSATGGAPSCSVRWVISLFVVLLILVLLAPLVASHEPFRSWVLRRAFPGVQGTITSSGASFGWFAPVELEGLRIGGPSVKADKATDDDHASDSAGPVISIDKIKSNRPLWRLLFERSSPGDFDIEKPRVNVVVTAKGSNLDGVFAPKSPQSEQQREELKALNMGIRIRGAELSVTGQNVPKGWHVGPMDAEFVIKDGVLELSPMTLFDHAQLTPQACHDFLRYVAPVLADATKIDGEFSLKLAAWKIPLYEPRQAAGSGLLEINSLNVQAGPLVAELAKMLRLSPLILFVKDSPVSFYMKDARVHHVDLTFYVEGMKMRTQGSVGLDETLDMMVEVPLPKHILGDGPLATALAQQTLVIPIGGTLSYPEIDSKRLGGSIQSLVRGTLKSMADQDVAKAEGFLQGLLRRGLDTKSAAGDKPDATIPVKPADQSGAKTTDAEALIGEIIGTAGNLLQQRRERRDAGEPTLLDRLRQQRRQRQQQTTNGAVNSEDAKQ